MPPGQEMDRAYTIAPAARSWRWPGSMYKATVPLGPAWDIGYQFINAGVIIDSIPFIS